MHFLYDIAIYLYGWGIRPAALFHNKKAKKWVEGRRDLFSSLQHWMATHDRSPIWIHCASLGEFEQGRPLIEALKKTHPREKIVLTFFSPSGYELRKNYSQADYVGFLPLDTPARARAFIRILRPRLAIFVKYEFWLNILAELKRQEAPMVLISAVFRPDQIFFKPYGRIFWKALQGFDRIFVQQEASAELLAGAGIRQWTIAGDTRVDRVLEIARNAPEFPIIKKFAGQHPVFIVGSCWGEDESVLLPFLNRHLPEDWRVIIAPHEIAATKLEKLEKGLALESVRYSEAAGKDPDVGRVLIIDNVGMLSALYQYGRIAYIGGGFGVGIHNILEPIAFGLPVLFGPNYTKFTEARELVRTGGGFSIENTDQLLAKFQELQDPEYYRNASTVARQYIADNSGSTQKILTYLEEKHLRDENE